MQIFTEAINTFDYVRMNFLAKLISQPQSSTTGCKMLLITFNEYISYWQPVNH